MVAAAAAKGAKSDPLYDLLGDREWIDAMVAIRMEDASAGVAELGRLGEAFHGARQLVLQIEEAIKARKKAVVDEAKEAARKSSTPPPLEPPVPAEPHDPQDKPEIPISTDMPWVVDQAIRALRMKATLPLYQRGGMLVQLTRDSSPPGLTWDPDAPSLRPVRHARLREMMSASARWMKMKLTQQGWEREPALPPVWAVDGVLARDEWPVRRALGVTEIPILRADGTVHDVDGYDDVSGYIHTPPRGLRLEWPAEALDQDLARRAYLRLCDPLIDFPFGSDCHRAAAVAALLSLVARPAIDGPCPLFPFLSTTPKSGKTFMVEILHLIATGREIARMAPGETEEEIEKRITMVTLAGFPAVLLDNLTGSFGGPSIDSVVQGRVWHGRILGRTESVYLPARAVWFVTGNNLGIKGDLAQRVIPVQLAPQEERPELRTNFVIPKLREYVKANRADLLTAAFTLLRCHAAAGRPVSGRPFGGYDDWNQVVRGALLWAGAPDPYAGVEQLAEVADERRDQTRAFLESWYSTFVAESVYLGDLPARFGSGKHPDLFASVKAIAGTKTGDVDFGRLGYFCRQARGRTFGGYRLEHTGEKRHGARAWRVQRVEDASGSRPPPSSPAALEDDQIPY